MIPQVAYLADAKLGSTISPHNESVGVVEPKLPSHPHPTLSKQRAHLISAQRLLRFQNFLVDRAGVLGVKRNFAPLQGLPQDDRSTHSLSDLGCEAGVLQSRLGDLAQNVGLGEFLGTDHNSLRLRPNGEAENQ